MTILEQRYMETVPMYLKIIADTLTKIYSEYSKQNNKKDETESGNK